MLDCFSLHRGRTAEVILARCSRQRESASSKERSGQSLIYCEAHSGRTLAMVEPQLASIVAASAITETGATTPDLMNMDLEGIVLIRSTIESLAQLEHQSNLLNIHPQSRSIGSAWPEGFEQSLFRVPFPFPSTSFLSLHRNTLAARNIAQLASGRGCSALHFFISQKPLLERWTPDAINNGPT